MEAYAKVLMIAIPFFIILMIIEYGFSMFRKYNVYTSFDTISSLSSGITNVIKDVLRLSIVIISYEWMYDKFHLFEIKTTWLSYLIAFIGLDFAGYWSHRFEHTVNVFWNRHIIHHSSEEFNLACALRQNLSSVFALFTFLLLPCALAGVEPKVIQILSPIHLFAQFWYHTRLIDKMGFLENLIVTPSHHRVHHAINDIYIDKNYSQIFIIWDKLFGTFQPELSSEPPVYGVKKPVSTWNPVWINFTHIAQLISDAYHTSSWKDRLRIWFMPTGWRPEDVAQKYPMKLIPYREQVKYKTQASIFKQAWVWVHFIISLVMLLYMFNVISNYNFIDIFIFGFILILSIYINTSYMDCEIKHAVGAEVLRLILVGIIVFQLGNFFGLNMLVVIPFILTSLFFNLFIK